MLAKIFPSQPAEPGFAQLMVRLRGEDALLSDLNFTLCNNEQYYLQPDGNWSPAPHTFTISGGYPFNKGSGFHIGPNLLDPLLASASQVQIQVQLATGETRNTTLQLVRDELFSSGARGQTANYGGSSVLDAPASAAVESADNVEEIQPTEPVSIPPATTLPARRKKSLMPIIVAVLLLLLIAAGAFWWFMGRDSAAPLATDNQPETPAATVTQPASSGCSPADIASQKELDFVQNCVQQQLGSDKLLAVIQAAKEAKQCGVAQRLYANRAQSGDTKIALAYAGEYDPQMHKPNECFNTPDVDTAIYWYETVLQTDPQNQKAKQRLEELKK